MHTYGATLVVTNWLSRAQYLEGSASISGVKGQYWSTAMYERALSSEQRTIPSYEMHTVRLQLVKWTDLALNCDGTLLIRSTGLEPGLDTYYCQCLQLHGDPTDASPCVVRSCSGPPTCPSSYRVRNRPSSLLKKKSNAKRDCLQRSSCLHIPILPSSRLPPTQELAVHRKIC